MARIVRRLARDMRDLGRAEAALVTSERRFRTVARLAPVGIFETSPEGQSIFQNEYWAQLTGVDPERGMGRGWEATIHPDDRWVPARFDAGVRTGEPFTLEHRYLRPDGQVRWVTSNVSPVRDDGGGITGWIGTTLDITRLTDERRVALEREAFVNALVEQSPVGIQVFSTTGEPIARNPAEQILLGFTDEGSWEAASTSEVDEVTRASVTRALAGHTVALLPRRLDSTGCTTPPLGRDPWANRSLGQGDLRPVRTMRAASGR
jgi:PAS domain S-box-containing protein